MVEQRLLVNHAPLFMSAAIKPVRVVRKRVFAPDQTADPIQAAAEAVQAAQHIKQMSEHAAPIPHTQVAFPVTSESRAATVLNVQEDCARRAMILPDDT